MKIFKIYMALILVVVVLIAQVGAVFAAPANKAAVLTGTVQSITLETDLNTAITTVLITIMDGNQVSQVVRLSVDSALALGLIITDENGMPVINPAALGKSIQIDPKTVILDDETNQHPVGDALATFFAKITDYETIMTAHNNGVGFGIIAQALWLTQKLEGNTQTFLTILKAKKTGDYSVFVLEDGTTPSNWGQFREAILNGDKKGNLGIVMSTKDNDEGKNGNGHGNGNGHSNNGNDNGNGNKDKDKDKDKGNNK